MSKKNTNKTKRLKKKQQQQHMPKQSKQTDTQKQEKRTKGKTCKGTDRDRVGQREQIKHWDLCANEIMQVLFILQFVFVRFVQAGWEDGVQIHPSQLRRHKK